MSTTAFELDGIFPANPTPRYTRETPLEHGDINYEALEEHLQYLEDGGVHGVTAAGCTGMSSSMDHDEHVAYGREVTERTDLPVILGTATNDTPETYRLATEIEEEADDNLVAHLMISPYKVKPEPDGVERHYEALADELEEPIILYDVPSRTGRQLDVDSVVSLAEHDNIIGIKDATGDYEHMWRVDRELSRNNDVEEFSIVSGDDPNSHFIYQLEHGSGTVSVTGNVAPEAVVEVYEQGVVEENYQDAYEMNEDLSDLHNAMFYETNPGPVHAALDMMGFDYAEVPSPLNEPSDENREHLETVLDEYDLLEQERAYPGFE